MFPQLFGKYVLEREIAAGGMARVYLATLRGAVGFEKRLVVKQIRTELASDAAFVARFVEEAKTAVELNHPNIVPVYELGVEQGVYYIAMELCEGLTLSDLLAETGPLGPAEGAYLGAEICRALDYAHRRAHIVHRDVTPRNVLIDDEGAVRLIDFGIAAPVTLRGDTGRGEVFGSPGHMPPEQLCGAALTPATDVFAVGALLIEAWTGCPPFRRASVEESEQALFEVPSPIGLRVPDLLPLSALISSSVALQAGDRPSAAEQLARPLREFLKSEDSGDIERRLAARVQLARLRLQAPAPGLEHERGRTGPRPATRSLNAGPGTLREVRPDSEALPVTRTFAVRDDLQVWTRKLPGAPAPDATSEPALGEPRSPSNSPSQQRRGAPHAAVLGPKVSRAGRSARFWWLLASASCVALAALISASGRAPTPSAVAAQVGGRVSALAAAASAAARSSADSTAAPVATPSAQTARKPPARPAAPRARSVAAGSRASVAPSAAPESWGELKITSDPNAQVSVSGPGYQQRERSPILGLRLPAGSYEVEFSNDTFGAPLSARVQVLAGGSRSVHADFRQAEPTIRVR